MVIYMRHPVHGTKVAVSEAEAVADEKNGWTRYALDSTPQVVEPAAEVTLPPRNTLHVKRAAA